MRVFQSETAVQNHPPLRQEVGLYSPMSINHWEEVSPWVRQFSDQGSQCSGEIAVSSRNSQHLENGSFYSKESSVCADPHGYLRCILFNEKNRFQKHVYSIFPYAESKHLCYFYKFLCLSLEKIVGRQILGSLYTLLQKDGSVKGKEFNEIINYFLYIGAILMIMATCQLYTVTFNQKIDTMCLIHITKGICIHLRILSQCKSLQCI